MPEKVNLIFIEKSSKEYSARLSRESATGLILCRFKRSIFSEEETLKIDAIPDFIKEPYGKLLGVNRYLYGTEVDGNVIALVMGSQTGGMFEHWLQSTLEKVSAQDIRFDKKFSQIIKSSGLLARPYWIYNERSLSNTNDNTYLLTMLFLSKNSMIHRLGEVQYIANMPPTTFIITQGGTKFYPQKIEPDATSSLSVAFSDYAIIFLQGENIIPIPITLIRNISFDIGSYNDKTLNHLNILLKSGARITISDIDGDNFTFTDDLKNILSEVAICHELKFESSEVDEI